MDPIDKGANKDHGRWSENEPKSYALSGKIMLIAIVILLVVVIFMAVLHIYSRWYLHRVRRHYATRRRARRQRATHIVFYVDPNNPNSVTSTAPMRGLDAAVLYSLPVFVYSSGAHPDALECAVCLSEFEENEKGRVLPKCQHSFHIECIDMWFQSHSTCPLCRSPVEPDIPVQVTQNNQSDLVLSVHDPTHTETGSSSGLCSTCQQDGGQNGSTSLADRRKGLNLVGVRIEVPRRNESDGESTQSRESSPASHGFKSPGGRLLSLKRILSMNRKGTAVSPSSGIGTSCGSVGTELDIELGRDESTQRQTRAQTPRLE